MLPYSVSVIGVSSLIVPYGLLFPLVLSLPHIDERGMGQWTVAHKVELRLAHLGVEALLGTYDYGWERESISAGEVQCWPVLNLGAEVHEHIASILVHLRVRAFGGHDARIQRARHTLVVDVVSYRQLCRLALAQSLLKVLSVRLPHGFNSLP